jgi:hypothetical protein
MRLPWQAGSLVEGRGGGVESRECRARIEEGVENKPGLVRRVVSRCTTAVSRTDQGAVQDKPRLLEVWQPRKPSRPESNGSRPG